MKMRFFAALVAAIASLGLVLGVAETSGSVQAGSTSHVTEVERSPSPADVSLVARSLPANRISELHRLTDTPAKRDALVKALQESFSGVAKVGVDSSPRALASDQINSGVRSVAYVNPVIAYGATWDHFWITASYADMARGAIWGAVAACKGRAPAWLCTYAGNVLSSWASGWGAANNHGVWAALYYYGRFDGGRW